jgi:photosystem II stability/assembly factor-like uncharacterized protein
MAIDPKDPNIVYLSGAYGGVYRFNRRTSFSQDVTPWPVATWGSQLDQRKYRATWTPVLVFSPSEPTALYLGTQYVMKTVDGGLHWETISPDLTGAGQQTGDNKTQGPPTVENAKQRGYGTVFTIAPSPVNRDLIWAGSDTGLIHLTRDGGKNWKDVTPPGLSAWSKISLIEASHFDPAVAYAAVDRSRLDDFAPHLYRTRDYGATWQPIANGISTSTFLRAIREDPQSKGLLFAGTEFGIYVSFDDGDHWQSLQFNLPVTSIRDLTVHGDDLVVATHGRSFWTLDNITPLRQVSDVRKADGTWLYRPAGAVRVDNDSFSGTPLPPEEPTAENPPNGAMIDYFLKSTAGLVKLEIFNEQQNLVRRFSSEDQRLTKRPSLPIAERWFPKPEFLEKTPGMHRFVWNLASGSSGGPSVTEDDEYRSPSGPKVVPGTYQVRLTVDGQEQSQPLQVVMDPRSPATPDVLLQQFQLGKQIFDESLEARRVLAEISSVQKQLADLQQKLGEQNPELKSALAAAQSETGKIVMGKNNAPERVAGLQEANSGLVSALQVVKSGDRAVPSPAIAVFEESSRQVKACIGDWNAFKQTKLPQLNQQLREIDHAPIAISQIEQEVEFLISQQ